MSDVARFRNGEIEVEAVQIDASADEGGRAGDWLLTADSGEQGVCRDAIFRAVYTPCAQDGVNALRAAEPMSLGRIGILDICVAYPEVIAEFVHLTGEAGAGIDFSQALGYSGGVISWMEGRVCELRARGVPAGRPPK